MQTRKVEHEAEGIRAFERLDVVLLNRNQGGVHLVVALIPIDPFVLFMEIKLAAFPAFVQGAGQVTAVLVALDLIKEFGEFACHAARTPPQRALDRMAQLNNPRRFRFGHG